MKSLIFTVSIIAVLTFYFFDIFTDKTAFIHTNNILQTYQKVDYNPDKDIVLKSEDITISTITKKFDVNRTTTYNSVAINDIKVVKILRELHFLDKDKNSTNTKHVSEVYKKFTDIEIASLIKETINAAS